MAEWLSDQLEEAYAIQQDMKTKTRHPDRGFVIRAPDNKDPSLVWKLDIGKKTQRRLVNGQEQSSRRIRRIFLSIDTVGSLEAGDSA